MRSAVFVALLASIACSVKKPPEQPPFRALTSEGANTHSPSLSPDARLVVYTSDRAEPGNGDVWITPVTGGEPKRLTSNPANDYEAVFSGDSQWVYFMSAREPQGIYRVPVSGGDASAELIALGGSSPRISPDGNSLLYGADMNIAVMNLADRSIRRPVADFNNSYSAVWGPEQGEILFTGRHTQEEPLEWWIVNRDGTRRVRTGILQGIQQAGFSEAHLQAWLPGDQLIFAGKTGDRITLYRAALSSDHKQLASAPARVTDDPAGDFRASYAAGHLAFDRIQVTLNLWSLPVDVNQGKVTGNLERVTSTTAQKGSASLSLDGTKLLYSAEKEGAHHLLLRELKSGKEKALSGMFYNALSPDGSRFAYGSGPKRNFSISSRGVSGWRSWWPRSLCTGCGMPRGFTADHRFLLTWNNSVPGNHIDLVEVSSGKARVILPDTGLTFYGPELSPDGKWLSFVAKTGRQVWHSYIARIPDNGPANPADWISVNPLSSEYQMAFWSPDGNLLYLLDTHREGNLTWLDAVRLDAATKRPVGEPFQVYHFEQNRVPTMDPIWNRPAAGKGRLVFLLGDSSSNIWIMKAP